MKGHWSRTYRTTKHLDNLCQASIKGKGNKIERQWILIILIKSPSKKLTIFDNDGVISLTHFDIFDFFEDLSGKIDHIIGDGNVCYD